MNVTSKNVPKSQAELTIEVSVEEAQRFIDDATARISKEISIKGFRKGKVPIDMLKQHVGEQSILEEAFNAIVEEFYPKAVEQEKLNVVGRANIDVEKLAPGNPIIFRVTIPLMPKVQLGNYKKLKTKKEKAELDEKKYEKTLMDLRRMRASEVVVDRAAKKDDKVVIDYVVSVGGVPIEGGTANNQSIVIGEGRFIPGFEENIEGMKKTEEKDFETSFPKDYHKKDLQDAKAKVHVKVHDVFEITIPELNEDMAKELNFESVAKLQEEIKKNITRELEEEKQNDFERAVIEEIVEASTFDELPDQLVDEETEKILGEMRQNIQQQGLQFDDYLSHLKKTEDDLKSEMREAAEKRIKAALVMREVAVAEAVEVTTEDIAKEVEEMIKLYAQMPDAATQLNTPEMKERIANMLVHKKTFEKLEALSK